MVHTKRARAKFLEPVLAYEVNDFFHFHFYYGYDMENAIKPRGFYILGSHTPAPQIIARRRGGYQQPQQLAAGDPLEDEDVVPGEEKPRCSSLNERSEEARQLPREPPAEQSETGTDQTERSQIAHARLGLYLGRQHTRPPR